MIGDFFSWIKRLGWIWVILAVIAPVAAGIVLKTVIHDFSTAFQTAHIHLPKLPKIKG